MLMDTKDSVEKRLPNLKTLFFLLDVSYPKLSLFSIAEDINLRL